LKLGQFFTLEELTRTSTGLDNQPDQQQLINLTRLVAVLDPIRLEVGKLRVTSGLRVPLVNQAVGGSPISFHLMGCAADIQSYSMGADDLFWKVKTWFEHSSQHIDKVILENLGGKSWVHIQTQPICGTNRNEYLIADGSFSDGRVVYKYA